MGKYGMGLMSAEESPYSKLKNKASAPAGQLGGVAAAPAAPAAPESTAMIQGGHPKLGFSLPEAKPRDWSGGLMSGAIMPTIAGLGDIATGLKNTVGASAVGVVRAADLGLRGKNATAPTIGDFMQAQGAPRTPSTPVSAVPPVAPHVAATPVTVPTAPTGSPVVPPAPAEVAPAPWVPVDQQQPPATNHPGARLGEPVAPPPAVVHKAHQDPAAVANLVRQTEDRAIDQRLLGSDPGVGYVNRAFSNVKGAPFFDASQHGMIMAPTNEAVDVIGRRAQPVMKQGPAAWNAAGIDAAKADPARRIGPPASDPHSASQRAMIDAFNNPTSSVRPAPSREERLAKVQASSAMDLARLAGTNAQDLARLGGANALALQAAKGKTDVDIAGINNDTEIKKATASEAEKVRRAQEKSADVRYQADKRLEGDKAKAEKGATPGEAKIEIDAKEKVDGLLEELAAIDPDPWFGKDQATAARQAIINRLALYGYGPDGKPVAPHANMAAPKMANEVQAGRTAPVKVMTQEDYNKLPVGSSYIDAQGNQRKKAK